ncbi:UNVERIFIED_CONTAM: hypothetical protein FKN15_077725 [Acipenser sinensis]
MAALAGCRHLSRTFRLALCPFRYGDSKLQLHAGIGYPAIEPLLRRTRALWGSGVVGRHFSSDGGDDLSVRYLEGEDSGIVVLGINRPKAKNAVSKNLVKMMAEAVDAVKVNKSVRTVILCSLVPGIFCAGEVLFTVSTMISSLLSSHVHHSRCLVNSSITVRYRIYIFGYGNFSGKVQQYPSL